MLMLAAGKFRNLSLRLPFWAVSGLLISTALTGGASRDDSQSLIFLWPVSMLALGWAILTLRKEHLEGRALLIAGMLGIIAINLLYLIPLPPGLWHNFPGRHQIEKIDMASALIEVWRPANMSPENGWHTSAALVAPLATLLFGTQLSRDDLQRMLFVLISIGALSAIFGILQVIDSNNSALYLYRITNTNSAVGLFANRNHAAMLLACLFPLLAVFATQRVTIKNRIRRQILAAAFATILVPVILITGSRSGLLLAIIGLVGGATLIRPYHSKIRASPVPIIIGITVILLGVATVALSRAEAVERLFNGSLQDDGRAGFWKNSVDLFGEYFPIGTGTGSFVQVYQLLEPSGTLGRHYLNRAHNDWIETATSYGLLGVAGLVIVFCGYCLRSWKLWFLIDSDRPSVVFSRMGGVLIAITGFASVSDYPLRTPIFMCIFVVFTLWFCKTEGGRES